MSRLPESLMNSLTEAKGFDKDAFEQVHASGNQITSIRINPAKTMQPLSAAYFPGISYAPVPWTKYGYYLAERPSFTFDPLFHAGCYYVQEASSMFLEQALRQTTDLSRPLRVLDLSAAPGGKSTHLQSLLPQGSLLLSNEVIKARAGILKDNIIKWGAGNVMVTSNDPKDFARLEGYFDVILVDAPCSGSGLFRRDAEAIDEWSLNNVSLCAQRQQRILADVWPALKNRGVLIYSTCSYSLEEDEQIAQWLTNTTQASTCRLELDPQWNIIETGNEREGYGYRFWPDKVKGEGFFLACFRKTEGDQAAPMKIRNKPEPVAKKELPIIEKWVNINDLYFIRHENTVYAWPAELVAEMSWLLNQLRVLYSGVLIGELMRDKLIPDHALALSKLVHQDILAAPLNYDQSIQYLQRKEMQVDIPQKGWQLVSYEGNSLGWINNLSNRINNYYPKELRILKDK